MQYMIQSVAKDDGKTTGSKILHFIRILTTKNTHTEHKIFN